MHFEKPFDQLTEFSRSIEGRNFQKFISDAI